MLNGATIVDTHDGTLARNMTIVIANGKIAQIARGGQHPRRPVGAHDRRARHVRGAGLQRLARAPAEHGRPEGALTLMLANGITGFRQLAASPGMLAARSRGQLMPPVEAPELLEMPGSTLAGPNARSPEAVVAEVQAQKAQGADFIKVIDARPDVFFAAVAESTRQGLRFLGHLPPSVNVRDAATAGMHSIEHMGPRDSILLGCSTDEAALRAIMAQNPPQPPPPRSGPMTASDVRRSVANPTVDTPAAEFVRYQRVIDTFNAPRSLDLAAHFVATGTWLNPTLIRVRTMEFGDDEQYWNDPNLRYVPKTTRAMWEDVSREFSTKLSAPARATLKSLFALQTSLVKPFKAAGVKMLAGTDVGGGFVIPGFSLHQEFDLLEEAGLAPLDVLQMTTLNGAQFLGRESTMGSVAEGKDANLVVLTDDPLVSVQNLHNISAVVRAGVYHSAADLDGMKKKTERRVATGTFAAFTGLPPCGCSA